MKLSACADPLGSQRARRTLRGIDEQVAKAERAVTGKAAVKRNRFIKLAGATKSVSRHKVGSLLASIGQDVDGVELTVTRDKTSREPLDLA